MTRVLVCGGRHFDDRRAIAIALAPYRPATFTQPSEHKIIHGGADGADRLADEWAKVHGVPVRVFLADWQKYGRSAGPRRNQAMLEKGCPDIVIAFSGGRGTADLVARARHAGVQVVEVRT